MRIAFRRGRLCSADQSEAAQLLEQVLGQVDAMTALDAAGNEHPADDLIPTHLSPLANQLVKMTGWAPSRSAIS